MKRLLALAAVLGVVQVCHAAPLRSHPALPPGSGLPSLGRGSSEAPAWTWVCHEGGPNCESGSEVALDGRGGVYVLGGFENSTTIGGNMLASGPAGSGFLAKYDVRGNLDWVFGPGGSGLCSLVQLHLDGKGNAWVIGVFQGELDFGGHKLFSNRREVLIAQIDSRGCASWAVQADVLAIEDSGFATALDSRGNLFLAGSFIGEIRIGREVLVAGNEDGYLARFDNAGSVVFVRQSRLPTPDWPQSLVVDDRDNLFVAGGVVEEATGATGQDGVTPVGRTYLSKYDGMGNEVWTICSGGGGGANWVVDLITDHFGNVIMAGQYSGEFAFGGHSVQRDLNRQGAFLASVRPDGEVAWLRSLGNTEYDSISDIAVDRLGNVHAVGEFLGQSAIGGELTNSGPYGRAYVARFDQQGRSIWARKINDRVWSGSLRLGLDGLGRARVMGERGGSMPGDPVITHSHLFVAGYDRDGRQCWLEDLAGDTLRMWSTFAVDRTGACFLVGSFQDELSLGDTLLTSWGSRDFFLARLGR